jgi:Fe-S cluster assembly protein SufD
VADKAATLSKTQVGLNKEGIEALSRAKGEPAWMLARRLEAWHLYEETPMPAKNDELWRRTSVESLRLENVVPFDFEEPDRRDSLAALPAKYQQIAGDANAAGVLAQHN